MSTRLKTVFELLKQELEQTGGMDTATGLQEQTRDESQNLPLGQNEDSMLKEHEDRVAEKIGEYVFDGFDSLDQRMENSTKSSGLAMKETNRLLANIWQTTKKTELRAQNNSTFMEQNMELLQKIQDYSKPAPRQIREDIKTVKVSNLDDIKLPETDKVKGLTLKAKEKSETDWMKMLLAGGILAAIIAKAMKGMGIDTDIFDPSKIEDKSLGIQKAAYKYGAMLLKGFGKTALKTFASVTGIKTGATVVKKLLPKPKPLARIKPGGKLNAPPGKTRAGDLVNRQTTAFNEGKKPPRGSFQKTPDLSKVVGNDSAVKQLNQVEKTAANAAKTAADAGLDRKTVEKIYRESIEKGSKAAMKKLAQTGGMEAAEKKAQQAALKRISAQMALKAAGKTGLRSTVGKIPLISSITAAVFGLERASRGDWVGAGMEVASGAASFIPGKGTLASVGVDAAIISRDLLRADEEAKKQLEEINVKNKIYQGKIARVVEAQMQGRYYVNDELKNFASMMETSAAADDDVNYSGLSHDLSARGRGSVKKQEKAKTELTRLMNLEKARLSALQKSQRETADRVLAQYKGSIPEEMAAQLSNNITLQLELMSDLHQSGEVQEDWLETFKGEVTDAMSGSLEFVSGQKGTPKEGTEEYKNNVVRHFIEKMKDSHVASGFFQSLGIDNIDDLTQDHVATVREQFFNKYIDETEFGSFTAGDTALWTISDNIKDEMDGQFEEFVKRAVSVGSTENHAHDMIHEIIRDQINRRDETGKVLDQAGTFMIDGRAYDIERVSEMYRSELGLSEQMVKDINNLMKRADAGDTGAKSTLKLLNLHENKKMREIMFRELDELNQSGMYTDVIPGVSGEDYIKAVHAARTGNRMKAFTDLTGQITGKHNQEQFEKFIRAADYGTLENNMQLGTTKDRFDQGRITVDKSGNLVTTKKEPGIYKPGQIIQMDPYATQEENTAQWKAMFGNYEGTSKAVSVNTQQYYDSLIPPEIRDLNTETGIKKDLYTDPKTGTSLSIEKSSKLLEKSINAHENLQKLSEQTNKSIQQLIEEVRNGTLAAPQSNNNVVSSPTNVTVNSNDGSAAIKNQRAIAGESIYRQ